MAIQKSIMTQYGLTASSCYIKIHRFNGDKNIIRFDVELYFNADARNNNNQSLEYRSFEIPTPNTDLFPALYNYLKTLPEFSGALDV